MFHTIVLAIDGSEPSHRATEVAAGLAAGLGSEVIVTHVHEHDAMFAAGYELETPEESRELVDSTVRRLKDAGVSARGQLVSAVYGRAARVLLETADHEGADVLVMGSRGLSDLAGLVLGSVTHKLLHLARGPVLVVR
jgi:nucleotide-binding universal stress UspA family protein